MALAEQLDLRGCLLDGIFRVSLVGGHVFKDVSQAGESLKF